MLKMPPVLADTGLADFTEIKTAVNKAQQVLVSLAHKISAGGMERFCFPRLCRDGGFSCTLVPLCPQP